MQKKTAVVLSMIISIVATGSVWAQKSNLQLLQTFHIASTGGWDYIALSPVHDWLYVTHGNQVNVLNKKNGDSVAVIKNTNGVHGIAFDVKEKKGFTSNGRLNSVNVFDINTNNKIGNIAVGNNPDAILFDSFSGKIITCNGKGNNLSIIDPVEEKLIDSIYVGGKPETAVSDGAGRLFVNIEDKNEIAVVDLKTYKVIQHWLLAGAEGPTGLAYDENTKRLFAGCDKLLVILNATNGNIIDKKIIGDGCDGVAFDGVTKNIYTSNGEGTMSVIHEISADKYGLTENMITKRGARTIAIDPETHFIYLPTAEFEGTGENGRPLMKPGTFQVLVIGNSK